MFYGRNDEQQRIVAAFSRAEAKNFAVIGPRRIGKTSLLQKIQKEISSLRNFHGIFLDSSPYHNVEEWYKVVLAKLQLDETCHTPREFISSIKQYCHNHKCTLVLFIDEIDNILRHYAKHDKDLFPCTLRALINEAQVKVLMAGYDTLYFQMRNHQSALFNMLEPIELSSLDTGSARALIEESFREIYTLSDKEVIPMILEKTGSYPNFIQFLCHQLVQQTPDRDIHKVRIDTVTDSPAFFNHVTDVYLQNLDEKGKLVLYLMVCHYDTKISAFIWEHSKYESSIHSPHVKERQKYQLHDTFTRYDIHRLLELYQINLSESELDAMMNRLVLACVVKRKQGDHYTFVLANLPLVLRRHLEVELSTVNLLENITETFKRSRDV
jgi:hypothetical protein